MPTTTTRSGLCATCSNSSCCTFWSAGGGAVSECLEFEAFAMSRPVAAGGYLSPMARSWFETGTDEIDGSDPRLCGTCRSRKTCATSRSRRGDTGCAGYR